MRARLVRVIAQEVGRLAHFRDRIGVRLAGLAHDEADELVISLSRVSAARRSIAARSVGEIAAKAGAARSPTSIAAAISSARA